MHACRLGKHFPRNPHNRDTSNPFWEADQEEFPNPNQLCGGVVSGPWTAPPSNGTDRHTDNKLIFRENEAAIDYSASFLCAVSAYADMPAGACIHQELGILYLHVDLFKSAAQCCTSLSPALKQRSIQHSTARLCSSVIQFQPLFSTHRTSKD